MTRQVIKRAGGAQVDEMDTACTAGAAYRRRVAAPRAFFAAQLPDLLTLVIADAIKRKAQAEIQRETLRDARYRMPASPERNDGRGADIQPFDADD